LFVSVVVFNYSQNIRSDVNVEQNSDGMTYYNGRELRQYQQDSSQRKILNVKTNDAVRTN